MQYDSAQPLVDIYHESSKYLFLILDLCAPAKRARDVSRGWSSSECFIARTFFIRPVSGNSGLIFFYPKKNSLLFLYEYVYIYIHIYMRLLFYIIIENQRRRRQQKIRRVLHFEHNIYILYYVMASIRNTVIFIIVQTRYIILCEL